MSLVRSFFELSYKEDDPDFREASYISNEFLPNDEKIRMLKGKNQKVTPVEFESNISNLIYQLFADIPC